MERNQLPAQSLLNLDRDVMFAVMGALGVLASQHEHSLLNGDAERFNIVENTKMLRDRYRRAEQTVKEQINLQLAAQTVSTTA